MGRINSNVVAALGLAAFGVYVVSVAAKLPYVSDVGPGPGFFPFWLGIGLVLFAAGLFAKSLTIRATADSIFSKSAGRALAGWLALVATVLLLGRTGFLLSFMALTMFLIVALDRRPASLAIIIALGLGAAFQLIFVTALDVPLPKGPWGF